MNFHHIEGNKDRTPELNNKNTLIENEIIIFEDEKVALYKQLNAQNKNLDAIFEIPQLTNKVKDILNSISIEKRKVHDLKKGEHYKNNNSWCIECRKITEKSFEQSENSIKPEKIRALRKVSKL